MYNNYMGRIAARKVVVLKPDQPDQWLRPCSPMEDIILWESYRYHHLCGYL